MKPIQKKRLRYERRKRHVRKKVNGTTDRPRLTVFRSHKYIYAQIIDDSVGKTLVASSSREAKLSEKLDSAGGNKSAARVVGQALAEKAIQKGIKRIVFDRNGYAFHGRVSELANAARKGGLEF